MLNVYLKGQREPRAETPGPGWRAPDGAVWFDFLSPTREEELAVEAALGLSLPTREEMAEIETSSRLYREDGAMFMTVQLLSNSQGEAPQVGPTAFVLAGSRLVTIRYLEPKAFRIIADQFVREPARYPDGRTVFLALLDEIIDRLADATERAAGGIETLSERIFTQQGRTDFRSLLRRLGRLQRANGKIRESAASLTRLVNFCDAAPEFKKGPARDEIEVAQRDIASIVDHSDSLSGTVTFLLDAALGMINIEQNAIIKIFSIGAVIFLPPTLIASYFGMNFEHMAIFGWRYGEHAAFVAMLASAAGALWWFRRKGWF